MVPEFSLIAIQGTGSGMGGVSMNCESAKISMNCQGLLQRYMQTKGNGMLQKFAEKKGLYSRLSHSNDSHG